MFLEERESPHKSLIKNTLYIFSIFLISFFIGQFIISSICQNFAPQLSLKLKSDDLLDPASLNIFRLIQIISCSFSFIIPSIILSQLISKNPLSHLFLRTKPAHLQLLYITIFMISIMPFMNIIIQWNESMVFPESLKDLETLMRSMEDSSKRSITHILSGSTIFDLIISIFVVAVLPAFGEEMFFRGILQKHFQDCRINYHFAIFLASFIFSAIHFQFYGFIPRLILGQVFGYLVYFSKSLWTSIFAHFLNNSIAVICLFFIKNKHLQDEITSFGADKKDIFFVLIGLCIAFFSAKFLIQKSTKNNL